MTHYKYSSVKFNAEHRRPNDCYGRKVSKSVGDCRRQLLPDACIVLM